ncbi:MAG: hypothetical protein AB7K24_06710, partial [Gemmataceae bacterium]
AGAVPEPKGKVPSSPELLQAKLGKIVATPVIERNCTLNKALKTFSERFEIEVVVDLRAFKEGGQGQDPREQTVELPAFTGISVRNALGKLASQVDGVIIQEGNTLWLVPSWCSDQALEQRIDVDYEDKPLEAALKDLAARSGVNVALDHNRTREAAKLKVSLKLAGTPLEMAVVLVADQAGLDVVFLDDMLYVTTPQNAVRFRRQFPHHGRHGDDLVPEEEWRPGPGRRFPMPPPVPEPAPDGTIR